MIKLKDKNAEVQFVYEEDDSKALHPVQENSISDEELSGLEFAAATVVSQNPLHVANHDNQEQGSQNITESSSPAHQVELSEEAKKQHTATVVHLNRQQQEVVEKDKSKEIKVSSDPTRESIRPQSLDKTPALKVMNTPNKPAAVAPQPVSKPRETVSPIEDESILERIHQIETHAEVRIALAEFKAEFLAEHLGEAKALEYQVKQLLKPLVKSNNEAMIKQVQKIFALLEGHTKGTIELVKSKAQAEKIVKPTQDKANKILQQSSTIKKAS